jgi:hypothetical protein
MLKEEENLGKILVPTVDHFQVWPLMSITACLNVMMMVMMIM